MQKTNFQFEILVHEDASTDGTEEIVKLYEEKYPNLFRCVYQSENQFLKQNTLVNILFKMAKGKYIALCEGDDYWTDPYKLQKQIDFLEANPDHVLCFHPVKILESDGRLVADHITHVPENYETLETMAAKGNYIHTPSIVFRNIIEKWPEELFVSPIGDFFIYMILGQHGKYGMLKDEMAVYRHQTGIWSKQNEKMKSLKFLLSLILIQNVFYKSSKSEINEILEFRIRNLFYRLLPTLNSDDLNVLRKNQLTNVKVDDLLLKYVHELQEKTIEKYSLIQLLRIIVFRLYKVINRKLKGK
jgi:glycosyltransferase involved in cell wall biosynthesis